MGNFREKAKDLNVINLSWGIGSWYLELEFGLRNSTWKGKGVMQLSERIKTSQRKKTNRIRYPSLVKL